MSANKFHKFLLICALFILWTAPLKQANASTWHLAPIIDGVGSTWHQLSCNPNFLSQWQPVGCSYSCPNGSLAGQSCIINTTAYIGATLNYYCPWGGYFDGGSTCIVPYTYGAYIVGWNYGWGPPMFSDWGGWGPYAWWQGWMYDCGLKLFYGDPWSEVPNDGSYKTNYWPQRIWWDDYGYFCGYGYDIEQWQPISPIYACNGGDWYDGGSTCYSNWYYGAASYYSCPGGWSLSGSSCTSGSISIVPAAKSPRTGW